MKSAGWSAMREQPGLGHRKVEAMTTDQGAAEDGGQMQGVAGATPDGRAYVVTPQAMAVEGPPAASAEPDEEPPKSVTDMVEQPAKVMRIGNMIRQLLEEVKASPLDEASRQRLRTIHQTSISELKDGLAPELVEELERITLPFSDEATPSDDELRIAQAQLVGWLEGLFHGIQTALFAQQMAARAQLEQMRRALPPGARQAMEQQATSIDPPEGRSSGLYL
jgi:Protein of unknown function (DUF2587)